MYETRTTTQTATQAKRLASRIGTELLQVRAFYGRPSESDVANFIGEAELYLAAGYLEKVRYGFERDNRVIFELVYTAAQACGVDDKPGRIPPDVDLSGATWFSFLKQNDAWWRLSSAQREEFRARIPVKRTFGSEPIAAPGLYTSNNKSFSEDTLGLRREVRRI